MQNFLQLVFKSRYTLLVSVLLVYVLVVVVEGLVTGREAVIIDFENPYFDMRINDLEELIEGYEDR